MFRYNINVFTFGLHFVKLCRTFCFTKMYRVELLKNKEHYWFLSHRTLNEIDELLCMLYVNVIT